MSKIQPTFYSINHPCMIGELPIWMTETQIAMAVPYVNRHGVLIWDHPECGLLLFKALLDDECGKHRWVQIDADVDRHGSAA